MNERPNCLESQSAIRRAWMSFVPPAGKPTTRRTGREGSVSRCTFSKNDARYPRFPFGKKSWRSPLPRLSIRTPRPKGCGNFSGPTGAGAGAGRPRCRTTAAGCMAGCPPAPRGVTRMPSSTDIIRPKGSAQLGPAGGRITSRPRARNQGRSLSARGLLRSHREHRRAHGLARLQVSMRLCGVFQRIGLLDLDLDRAREHHPEEILCHRREIGTGGSVGV